MKPSDIGRELVLPLTSPAVFLALILFFALYQLALLGHKFGMVIAIVFAAQLLVFVLPALLRYLMDVLSARAAGRVPEPLNVEHLSWFGNLWSLFPIVHVVVFVYAVYLSGAFLGGTVALGIALAYAVLSPASLVILAVTHSVLESLRPSAIVGLIRGCGPNYLIGPVFVIIATWLVIEINVNLNLDPVTELISFYMIFAAFALFGGIVRPLQLQRELDIPTPTELDEETQRKRHLLQRTMILNHAYGIVSRGNRAGGLEHLYEELENDADSETGWAWFFENMLRWENPEAALVFAQQYVHRLLRHGENVAAVKVMLRCRMVNPAFKPLFEDLELAANAAEQCHNEELANFLR